MAKSFPSSEFIGIDYHAPSIDTARRRAAEAAVRNARFEVADATSYAGTGFDFIAFLIACTTWVIRSAQRGTRARRSSPMGIA